MTTHFPTSSDSVTGILPKTDIGAANNAAAILAIQASLLGAGGVASGIKVARGVHTQVAASDTVATGLATVVAVVVNFQDAPTIAQLFCSATIGDQAGTPAAGSFLLRTYKPTGTGDVTPLAATDFTGNLNFNWIAIGT